MELVAEGGTGQLVAPGTVEQLADALQLYTTDEALRREHGQTARRFVLERFSLPAMMASYQRVYDRVRSLAS